MDRECYNVFWQADMTGEGHLAKHISLMGFTYILGAFAPAFYVHQSYKTMAVQTGQSAIC